MTKNKNKNIVAYNPPEGADPFFLLIMILIVAAAFRTSFFGGIFTALIAGAYALKPWWDSYNYRKLKESADTRAIVESSAKELE